LQTRLIGDILILVSSVSMRKVFKMHKLYYDMENSVDSPEQKASNDLEEPLQRKPQRIDSFVSRRHETLKLIYHRYISISLLDEWYSPISSHFI